MKYYIVIIILLFLNCSVFPQSDTIKYDNGNFSIGRLKKYGGKTGLWKTYDAKWELVEKAKYKFSLKHGKSINYEGNNRIKERYYYGINKNERTVNGKKILAYYYYGLFSEIYNCDEYSCTSVILSGDAIWTGLRRKVFMHNLIIDIRQKFRYGLKWNKDMCNKKNNKLLTKPKHNMGFRSR